MIECLAKDLPRHVELYLFDDLKEAEKIGGQIYSVKQTCRAGTYYEYFVEKGND